VPAAAPGSARHGANGQVRASRALQHGAGDETRPGQVDDGRGHIRGGADPAHRAGGRHGPEEAGPLLLRQAVPLADLAYGVLWYRLLIGHAPLDAGAARDLAAHLIAAGRAGEAGSGPA